MRESSSGPVALDSLQTDGWPQPVRELLDAVIDVARRLSHNVVGLEHLLIAGAENGVESMARTVPNLAAFREALLDAIHDDRESFRRLKPKGAEEQCFLQPALLAFMARLRKGDSMQRLLAEAMLADVPRIARAVTLARGTEPEVLPPDTLALAGDSVWDPSLAGAESTGGALFDGAGGGAGAGERGGGGSTDAAGSGDGGSAAAGAASTRAGRRGGEPRMLPLTSDLCRDAAEDLPLIGRRALLEQVARILLRFHEPVVLIVGEPGTGKTAFLRGLARAACTRELPALEGFRFHQLRILDLVSQSHRGQDIHNLMDQLLGHIAADPTAVLVIDDLHLLLARQGYPMITDVIDTVKLHLKRGKLRALLSVNSDEFEKSFSGDSVFGGEIAVRRLAPLPREDVAQILRDVRPRLEQHFHVKLADEALESAAAVALAELTPDYQPPGSAIRLLDATCALARARGLPLAGTAQVTEAARDEAPAALPQWDKQRLAHLADRLKAQVLGQDLAAEAVARRVRLSKLHFDRKPNRPDGVFLFIGPSGVGKTELARALARALYDDESRLVRLDMSEYMESHSIARIIGAPPGYVGYGEDGALTTPIARMGHGVVLLDEIEKAHPQVLNLFLQVFDDGRLTDSKGRLVDFSDTVIIMTSNIGRELYAIHGERAIGFGAEARPAAAGPLRDAVQEYLLRVLPSEFVNRIDEIVPFRVLEDADIRAIAERLLVLEASRWTARGKTLTWDAGVVDVVATSGYDPRLGARHIERNLERLVIALLSDAAVGDGFEAAAALHLEPGLALDRSGVRLLVDGKAQECPPRPERMIGAPVEESNPLSARKKPRSP